MDPDERTTLPGVPVTERELKHRLVPESTSAPVTPPQPSVTPLSNGSFDDYRRFAVRVRSVRDLTKWGRCRRL